MKHLLENWEETAERIREAERVLLAFDYDGTLTPIVSRPEDARLGEETRALLGTLSCRPRYRVAVVSGRRLDEVRDLVGLPGLIYAGNHGLELEGGGWRFLHPAGEKARPVLEAAAAELQKGLAGIAGARVEDKGLTISVHLRRVSREDRPRALETVNAAAARRSGELRVTRGKEVIEFRPAVDWGKGEILAWLAEKIGREKPGSPVLTVYTGDDRTDEDAFLAVGESGITIKVGGAGKPSAAAYRLEDCAGVKIFLARLRSL